jgi:hypothetical protein
VAIDQPSGKHAEVKRQTKARRFVNGRISFSFTKTKKKKRGNLELDKRE